AQALLLSNRRRKKPKLRMLPIPELKPHPHQSKRSILLPMLPKQSDRGLGQGRIVARRNFEHSRAVHRLKPRLKKLELGRARVGIPARERISRPTVRAMLWSSASSASASPTSCSYVRSLETDSRLASR